MNRLLVNFFALAILGVHLANGQENLENRDPHEDAKLSVRELISKYGYRGETHVVNTEDGYILKMHRITGPKGNASAVMKQPVLLMHPLLSSSFDFVITGPGRALAYVLADEGYDVWIGNIRGNYFSRSHKQYTTLDKEYWQFSWHETGVVDIPAMIDYILEKTFKKQILYVGHSQGTTAFWVMASERPDYQRKVKAMVALAPVAYLENTKSPFYHVLAKFGNRLELLAKLLGEYEFEPAGKLVKEMEAIACDNESWIQPLCTSTMFLIAGPSKELDVNLLPNILAHVPAGGSVRQILHFLQVLKARRFQQYDYGVIGNLKKYYSFRPPTYALSKIKLPVYIFYSSADWFSDPIDVSRLHKQLPNAEKFRVPHDHFAHLDFIWANNTKAIIYDRVVAQLKKHPQ